MLAKRAWICTKKYHPVEVLSGTCSLMVWFFKASSSVVIKGFNGWRKTSVFLQPVELDWRWSILRGLRQLRDVWKGVCSPGNFLGPLSSSSRTRIWSLLPWGSHQGVSPAQSALKIMLNSFFTLASSQSFRGSDFQSIHGTFSFHSFSAHKFCLTLYMISQVCGNKTNRERWGRLY